MALPLGLALVSEMKYLIISTLLLVSYFTLNIDRQTIEGKYTWGNEVNTIQLCDSDAAYWVVATKQVYDKLREFHKLNTSEPYESVFIKFSGDPAGIAIDGFAKNYDGLFKVKSVKDMQVKVPKNC